MRVLLCLVAVLFLSASVAPAAVIVFGGDGPRNLLAPQLTGDPRVGGTLTCTRGTWDDSDREPYAVEYRWYRDDNEIAGASEATYTVTPEDADLGLDCQVTAVDRWRRNGAGSGTVQARRPVSLTAPALTGDDRIGGQLSCTSGTWDDRGLAQPYPLAYAWLRDGDPIDGAITNRYTVTRDDIGKPLACTVIAAESGMASSGAAHPDGPRNGTRPHIGGDPRAGGTLTCSPGTWDGDYVLTYAWRRDGEPIATAVGATYLVNVLDADHDLTCAVTAAGLTVAVSAAQPVDPPAEPASPAGTVAVSEPAWTSAPVVRGDVRVGRTVSCSDAGWDGDYRLVTQWRVADRVEATGPGYTVTAGDVGEQLACDVVAAGRVTAPGIARAVPAPRALTAPAIERVGDELTCTRGTWDEPEDAPYATTYAWQRDGAPISGTEPTLVADAVGSYRCTVTVLDGAASELSAPVVIADAGTTTVSPAPVADPVNRTAPAITGFPRLKGTLTCAPGTWDATYAFTYRWLQAGTAVGTAATITPTAVGELTCEVTAAGTTTAATTVTITDPRNLTPPSITGGDPRIGTVLTCNPGSWDGAYAFSYRWLRDVDVLGTAATHTVTADDLGTPLSCEVTAEGITTATAATEAPRGPVNLTAPALTGDPILRGLLRCGTGTWDGAYTLSYRWFRDDAELAGETGSAHTVTLADLDSEIRCAVTAEDMETAESEIADVERPRLLDGNERNYTFVGRPVTCGGAWNDRAGLRYQLTYQWWHNYERFVPIPGADRQTYVLTAGDVGSSLECRVIAEGTFQYDVGAPRVYWEDLALYASADKDSAAPGAENGYTLTARNLNPAEHTLTMFEATLPEGFSYTPGSTTGATTANPAIDGRRLRWTGSYELAAESDVKLHFKVTGAAAPGNYRLRVDADWDVYSSDGFAPRPVGDAARITVETPPACTITGTPANDVLAGTPGDDVICGLGGNDRIAAGAGNDTLVGGDGNDTLDGGAGADVLRGGGGLDTATYADRLTQVVVSVDDPDPDGTPEIEHDDGSVTAAEGDDVTADVEVVRGGKGPDNLQGAAGDQELYGGAGGDVLNGGTGDDLLEGGAGDDWLSDSDGRYDQLLCGAGFDTYEYDDHDTFASCEFEPVHPEEATR